VVCRASQPRQQQYSRQQQPGYGDDEWPAPLVRPGAGVELELEHPLQLVDRRLDGFVARGHFMSLQPPAGRHRQGHFDLGLDLDLDPDLDLGLHVYRRVP